MGRRAGLLPPSPSIPKHRLRSTRVLRTAFLSGVREFHLRANCSRRPTGAAVGVLRIPIYPTSKSPLYLLVLTDRRLSMLVSLAARFSRASTGVGRGLAWT